MSKKNKLENSVLKDKIKRLEYELRVEKKYNEMLEADHKALQTKIDTVQTRLHHFLN